MGEKRASVTEKIQPPGSQPLQRASQGRQPISPAGRPQPGGCFLSIRLSETFLADQGGGKVGGEQWNALSCLPLTRPPVGVHSACNP